MKKLLSAILSLVMAATMLTNVAFAEVDPSEWETPFIEDEVLVIMSGSGEVTVDDFPLLDLVSIEELYSSAGIYLFKLAESGEDKVREAIDIIEENYPNISHAEPNNLLMIEFEGWTTGDTDGDNALTIKDAILAMNHIVGNVELTWEQFIRADVNGDDIIDTRDVVWIAQTVVGHHVSPLF